MIEQLKKLCSINGISGDENKVREYICREIERKAEYQIDNLGNIIAFKKGKTTPKNKVMVSAHLDEVGFIVTYINDDGTLKFAPVGGVDPRVVFGRRVTVGRNEVTGVIGGQAVHNLSADQRKKAPTFDTMCIDIGCESKADTEKLVALGDSVCFNSEVIEFGDNKLKGKAIDDRAGCAIMLDMINSELEYDTWFTFVVQEELGLRGATVAAYTVSPDYAIVLEATTAGDIASVADDKKVCTLGNGPVVSFMDKRTIYDKELYNLAFDTAIANEIPCQTKTMIAGGNDAGAIHTSRGGVRTLAISVPCRYLHSASCVIDIQDFNNTARLAKLMLDRIYNK